MTFSALALPDGVQLDFKKNKDYIDGSLEIRLRVTRGSFGTSHELLEWTSLGKRYTEQEDVLFDMMIHACTLSDACQLGGINGAKAGVARFILGPTLSNTLAAAAAASAFDDLSP